MLSISINVSSQSRLRTPFKWIKRTKATHCCLWLLYLNRSLWTSLSSTESLQNLLRPMDTPPLRLKWPILRCKTTSIHWPTWRVNKQHELSFTTAAGVIKTVTEMMLRKPVMKVRATHVKRLIAGKTFVQTQEIKEPNLFQLSLKC